MSKIKKSDLFECLLDVYTHSVDKDLLKESLESFIESKVTDELVAELHSELISDFEHEFLTVAVDKFIESANFDFIEKD